MMLETILLVLVGWLILSVPVSLLFGKWIRAGRQYPPYRYEYDDYPFPQSIQRELDESA